MVTWGVTDAGGRRASTRSAGDDAGADTVASVTTRRRLTGPRAPPPGSDVDGEARPGGLPTITVEPTPDGLATGLSHVSAGLATTDPRRSHPAYRRSPPPLEVGDRTRVPARVRAATPAVDVTLELPASLPELFVAAPLAYYLPASVRVSEGATPRLFLDGEPRETLSNLEDDAALLLRRVFHLDCLVRRGPFPVETPTEGNDFDGLLDSLGLDPASLRSRSPAGRLDRYLTAWDPGSADGLPDWHLSTSVDPSPDAVRCLPALLERLSLINRPEGEPRDRSELLDMTLSTAYRTRGGASSGEVLAPSAPAGRFQGWLAPGKPVEAFKPTGAAFDHRSRYRARTDGSVSVAIVVVDADMTEEGERVADVYRQCTRRGSSAVDVIHSPTRAALRETIQRERDVFHYVGHCDDAGLRCADGHLAIADLPTCRVPTFFLNACGSYDEGLALVERGAVAGAVTFADVLDRHATRVGTAFARLLAAGFSVQRALQLARRRILMGQDYAVVGDGTFAPRPTARPPGVVHVESEAGEGDERTFEVTYEMVTIRTTGERHSAPIGDGSLLNGDSVRASLSSQELRELLTSRELPVIYDDDLLWAGDLREKLAT